MALRGLGATSVWSPGSLVSKHFLTLPGPAGPMPSACRPPHTRVGYPGPAPRDSVCPRVWCHCCDFTTWAARVCDVMVTPWQLGSSGVEGLPPTTPTTPIRQDTQLCTSQSLLPVGLPCSSSNNMYHAPTICPVLWSSEVEVLLDLPWTNSALGQMPRI